jgi:hypothetical protein
MQMEKKKSPFSRGPAGPARAGRRGGQEINFEIIICKSSFQRYIIPQEREGKTWSEHSSTRP